ncbi:MAG: glycerol dehydrogenase [Bacillota bacterium]|nr:glycerol dehydrogenase [Bacillota bacterium]MDW7730367.1 glycerol dehydrogenase [Bacillota bacterium]
MINKRTRGFASPGKYIQGPGELNKLEKYTSKYGKNVAILIDRFLYAALETLLSEQYAENNNVEYVQFGGECSIGEIDRFKAAAADISADVIVGIGGGKTLDAAKAAASKLLIPVIIAPTAASTDSPTSAMSIVYTDEGVHEDFYIHESNPNLVLVDTDIIMKAPVRLFIAGMGDALATYFEALSNEASDTANYVGEGYRRTMLGMAISKLCYETLITKGLQAKIDVENGCCTEIVEDIIEANILLSGLGFENTGCAAAHGIHAGLTALPQSNPYFHGEKVAFGTICQLILENKSSELLEEVIGFCLSVGLPVTLKDLGIEDNKENIRIIAGKALIAISSEPFVLTEAMLFNAIKAASEIGKAKKEA